MRERSHFLDMDYNALWYISVCERVDFCIRFDTLWHSCGISTRQWKGLRCNK